MIDEDALKIEDFSLTGPWQDEDAASLPSFKPLPERAAGISSQADRPTPKPPEGAQRDKVTSPPLDLAPWRLPEPWPSRVPPRRRRMLHGLALLLVGSSLGAAVVYLILETNSRLVTAAKYYAALPPAVPAAPPPEILYVDKWQIVAIDPFSLAEAAKIEPPAQVEPPKAEAKALGMFAPAMPIAPPPKIIMIERRSTKRPEMERPVAEMRPPPPARPAVPVTAEPKKFDDVGDVLEQINSWLSGASKR